MFRKFASISLLLVCAAPLFAAPKEQQEFVSDLFALIDQADQMVVYSEGFKRETVVYRSSERKDFEELKAAITLKKEGGPFVCACMDGPEISLVKDQKEIAAIWNHEGTAIGSSVWEGDWENQDPDRWLRWFDARGMKYAREEFNQAQAQREKADEDEQRWFKAMPASLKPLWPNALKSFDPGVRYPDLQPLNDALSQQYPDDSSRIRALMAWYGSGSGPWSGFPAYEEIAEKLLRHYSTLELIRAIDGKNLTSREVEGAARILADWTPIPDHTPIPVRLRRMLLDACLKSTDQDKIQRAKKAFGPEN